MIDAVLVGGLCGRLAHIVQEHGEPQHRIRFNELHGMERVLAYRIAMVRILLFRLHHPVKFREKYTGKSGGIRLPEGLRMIGDEKL